MNANINKPQSNQENDLPIVLIHGTCGRSEDWSHVVGGLSQSRTVIRPDYGLRISDEAKLGGPALSDFVAAVVAEINEAGIQRFDIVGASLGAAIAIGVAAEQPDRVNSLVLQSGFAFGNDSRLKLLFDAWLHLAQTDKITFTKLILANGFSRGFLSAFDEPTLNAITEGFVAAGDWTRIEQAIGVDLKVDVRTQAKLIKAPTLIITAMHDQIVSPDYTDELSALIEHAVEAELESGHLVFLEKPLDLVTAILNFYGAPAVG